MDLAIYSWCALLLTVHTVQHSGDNIRTLCVQVKGKIINKPFMCNNNDTHSVYAMCATRSQQPTTTKWECCVTFLSYGSRCVCTSSRAQAPNNGAASIDDIFIYYYCRTYVHCAAREKSETTIFETFFFCVWLCCTVHSRILWSYA